MCVGLSLGRSTPRIRGMTHLVALALTLLVPRVGADDVQASLTPDQLAVLADTFHAGSNFHDEPRSGLSLIHRRQTRILVRRRLGSKGGNCRKPAARCERETRPSPEKTAGPLVRSPS